MPKSNGKLHGKKPKPLWVKPWQDPLVKEVSHVMEVNGTNFTDMQRKTGLCAKTISNLKNRITGQPHPSTLSFVLRYYNKELVIRDKGSNE